MHNKASTFLDKRQDRFWVKILLTILKIDSKVIAVIRMLKRQCAIKKSYKKTIVILFPLSENIQPSILSSNKNKNTIIIIIIFYFFYFFKLPS